MENITIDRNKLLEIVRENRTKHRAVFEEALKNYTVQAVAWLEENAAMARAGKRFGRSITLPQPIDQTPEYDRAIRMLELHQGATLSIDENTFANLVEDNWSWSRTWTASNSGYVSTNANREYLGTKLAEF